MLAMKHYPLNRVGRHKKWQRFVVIRSDFVLERHHFEWRLIICERQRVVTSNEASGMRTLAVLYLLTPGNEVN